MHVGSGRIRIPGKRPGTAPVIGLPESRLPAAAEAPGQFAGGADVAGSDRVAFAPSACRPQDSTPEKGPYVRVEIGGKDYLALVDTGSTLSLIGDSVYTDCRRRNLCMREVVTPLRLAVGSAEAQCALRLHLGLDGKRRRQRFVYLPGMSILVILGQDFVRREGIILDLKNNGYDYSPLTPLIPFVAPPSLGKGSECSLGRLREEQVLAARAVPDNVEEIVASFDGPAEQRRSLADASSRHAAMFTERPGVTHVLHEIDTGDARPWGCNPIPLSVHKRALLDKALDEMWDTGAVRPSQSPWAFPVVLAPKKDRTARLCVDYHRLNEMTKRDVYPFPSIESIMYSLGSAKVFTSLDSSRGFLQIQTNASDYGVGAVFLQEHDGQLRPVAFASRTLTPPERNYSVTEKEGLAVMFTLKKFDLYLDGTTFVIQTDHAALTWIQRLKEPAGRLARWAVTLQRYFYTVEYRKGSSNKVADALPQAPQDGGREEETRPVGGEERGRGGRIPPCARKKPPAIAGKRENGWEEGKQPEFVAAMGHSTREQRIVAWGEVVSKEELVEAQGADGFCQRVLGKLAEIAVATGNTDGRIGAPFDSYLLGEDGLLLRYIPAINEEEGNNPLFRVVSSLPEGETKRRETSGVDAAGDSHYPWEIVACDIVGPLSRSPRGNQYLLVITDHFSKWVDLYPLRKLVSERIWEKLLDTFLRFGTPKCLVSDNASYFTSKVFVNSSLALNIKHKRTTPYHPQANITERVNRNLMSMLIALMERHRDWDGHIVEMGFAIRTSVKRSTGFTPAFLNLGKELPSPLENGLRNSDGGSGRPLSTYAAGLNRRLTHALHNARENLDAARIEQVAQYDKNHRHLEYNVGDLVLRRMHPLSNAACGFAASLVPKRDGPYEVSTRVSRLTYSLTWPNATEESGPVHVTNLKGYYLRDQDGDGREAADEDGENPVSAGRQAQSGARMKRGGRTVHDTVGVFTSNRSFCQCLSGTTPDAEHVPALDGDDPSQETRQARTGALMLSQVSGVGAPGRGGPTPEVGDHGGGPTIGRQTLGPDSARRAPRIPRATALPQRKEQRGTVTAGGTGLEPAAMPHGGDLDDMGGQWDLHFMSRQRWRDQPRPVHDTPGVEVPPPFLGHTLPSFELAPDLQDPFWLCRVPVVHHETHEASPRHQELLRAVGPPTCVEAALRLLQKDRPDLLAPAARELPEEGVTSAAAAAASTAAAPTAAAAATAVSDPLPPPLVPLPCSAEPLAAPLPPPPAEDTVMTELEEFLAGYRPPSADSGPPGSEP
ncbi:uncharacterized protein ISCGN_030157 [Ixodes scapularis]